MGSWLKARAGQRCCPGKANTAVTNGGESHETVHFSLAWVILEGRWKVCAHGGLQKLSSEAECRLDCK